MKKEEREEKKRVRRRRGGKVRRKREMGIGGFTSDPRVEMAITPMKSRTKYFLFICN
jgi:hypothetical protein